jgi:uncharacterized membrane protein
MPNIALAQSSIDPKIWLYFALLLVVLFIGAIIIFALRRKLFSQDDHSASSAGGGLMEHLDNMLKSGEITKEEYDITRRTIINKAVEQMDKTPTDNQDEET